MDKEPETQKSVSVTSEIASSLENLAEQKVFKRLGPGLITGAADDDPSGVATYSQVGAQFGNQMLWTVIITLPLMSAIQEVSARIGRVTGMGIAGNIRSHYSRLVLYIIVGLMVLANIINIGADIAAMGKALEIMIGGGPPLAYSTLFAIVIIALQFVLPFKKYFDFLKWLTLVLFAYVGTAFVSNISWSGVFRSTLLPHVQFDSKYLTSLIAVFGTTISPYLFFWQASLEVEKINEVTKDKALKRAPGQARFQLSRIRMDTIVGMAFSNLIAWFIILATAATLHMAGKTDIQSAEQAAEALKPIAGNFAFILFSLGIIGTGLLGVPALSGAAAFSVSEAFDLKKGLDQSPFRARAFYGVIGGATLIGLFLDFTGIDPIKALLWSAEINGVVAVPIMATIMVMASSGKIMGKFTLSPIMKILGWAATAVMLAASAGMILTWGQ